MPVSASGGRRRRRSTHLHHRVGPGARLLTGSGATRSYTPGANYHGADSFTFRVNDGQVDSNVATVPITVTPVNDVPTATNAAVSTDVDTAVGFMLAAADADGDTLSLHDRELLPHTAPSRAPAASRTYTPDANFDGHGFVDLPRERRQADSAVATVTIRREHGAPAHGQRSWSRRGRHRPTPLDVHGERSPSRAVADG